MSTRNIFPKQSWRSCSHERKRFSLRLRSPTYYVWRQPQEISRNDFIIVPEIWYVRVTTSVCYDDFRMTCPNYMCLRSISYVTGYTPMRISELMTVSTKNKSNEYIQKSATLTAMTCVMWTEAGRVWIDSSSRKYPFTITRKHITVNLVVCYWKSLHCRLSN